MACRGGFVLTPLSARLSGGAVVAADAGLVPWWSFTKTALAAAALVLAARGLLVLDDALPGEAFTLAQLLQHRAGLADYGHLPDYHRDVAAGGAPWSAAEMRRRVAALAPPRPGSFAYSNLGYQIVRELIEQATGSTLDEALHALVLDPLDIRDSFVAGRRGALDAIVWGNLAGYDPGWVYHGLLVGPPAGAALLLHRLLHGDLLPRGLLGRMCEALPAGGAVPDRPWLSAGYGMGLMIGTGMPDGRYLGHTGGGPGSSCAVYCCADGASPVTASVFAPVGPPGMVERQAMAMVRGV